MKHIDCLLIAPSNPYSHALPYPYLGLCYLAGTLKARGISTEILDCSALKLKIVDVVNTVKKIKPRIIGISAMSMNLRGCYQIIQSLKGNCRDIKIVVGGAHVNADQSIVGHMGLEYGFHGESEFAFAEFCERIIGGLAVNDISGLIVNDEGIITAQPPAIIDDLDELPPPAYELLPLDRYRSALSGLKTISMITSRGCPYNCIFCSRTNKSRYRFLSVDKVVSQIQILVERYGFEHIEFVDELFTLHNVRVMDICKRILEQKLNFTWSLLSRADKIDDEILMTMKEAGCARINLGVETGSERVRFADNKKINNEKYIDAVKLCRKHGIKTNGFYILGHPSETVQEMWQTVKFARQLNTDTFNINKMIPLPDSELYETAVASGQLSSDVWRSFMLGERPHPIYYPEGVAPKVMDMIYVIGWLTFIVSPSKILANLAIFFKPRLFYKTLKMIYVIIFGKRYDA